MKRLLILFTWFLTTAITLFTSVTLYSGLNQTRDLNALLNHEVKSFVTSPNAVTAYAALPNSVSQIRTAVLGADARPVTIDAYLERYQSPMQGYGNFIVNTADDVGLDPYLIVAIAQQESNLCKIIPDDSHNCWGWGIHKDGTLKFESFEIAIQTVTQGIKEKYIDKGYDTPLKIMGKYTPNSQGSWAAGVNQFLAELSSGEF